jgi:threonine dehydratase
MAAAMQEAERMRGKRIAVILSGGNCDQSQAAEILAGHTPLAAPWQIRERSEA